MQRGAAVLRVFPVRHALDANVSVVHDRYVADIRVCLFVFFFADHRRCRDVDFDMDMDMGR